MKKNLLKKLASLVGVVMLFAVMSCGGDDECTTGSGCSRVPMEEPQDTRSFGVQMREYLERDQKEEGGFITEGKYSAYFDFSDGMENAYTLPTINPCLNSVTHSVAANGNDWEVYGLEQSEVKPLGHLTQTELFNRIVMTKNELMFAPIEDALMQIVKDKKPALLVTDFEEYKWDELMKVNVIEAEAYATKYFQQWMSMGGTIKFYIMPFTENGLNKKLFFVVFDGKSNQLIKEFDFRMQSTGQRYDTYVLQSTPYKVSADYPVGKGGNFVPSNGIDAFDFQYFPLEEMNAESYEVLKRSWLQMAEELMYYRKKPDENYKGLLSRLYVDLSDTQSRNIEKLEVRVTDITKDFNDYTQYCFVKGMAPQIGEDGTVELTCDQRHFYDENGDLLPNYQYRRMTPTDITKERFLEINQAVFEQSRRTNPGKTEIAIDFGKEYSDSTLFKNDNEVYELLKRDQVKDNVNGRILKVDVCIAQSGVTNYSELGEIFNFQSNLSYKNGEKNGKPIIERKLLDNTCITQSVIETLRKGDLDGRVIYTFIIKDNAYAD